MPIMISDVTDLEVYQSALGLLPDVYALTKKFPNSENDLVSQLQRAAKSIPANIAEGYARRSHEKEFKRFLKFALGSSDEIITHLRVAQIVIPKLSPQSIILMNQYIILSKRINTLCTKWRSAKIF